MRVIDSGSLPCFNCRESVEYQVIREGFRTYMQYHCENCGSRYP